MPCSACGARNPAGAKFCGSCGTALAAACPRCGHQNAASLRFCTECGGPLATPVAEPQFASPQHYVPRPLAAKIRAGRADLEGERKLITVLFADVAGFTALSERLDPEDCHAMM